MPVEQQYIRAFAENADISIQEKLTLLNSLDDPQKFMIDYKVLAAPPDDAIGLLLDLAALAKRDRQFHISKKMYIKQVGKLLGFSDSDVEEAIV